ncbi:MAG: sigma factor-like helix-turn-helix DNA-binding protein [Candidatus Izemoplasmatales bacterium]|jgi:hypothetical protein|nr:sigma factor-like helix-turn-helix DNA-binding protein [Candidatus Izemoplasmatales bacterium]
MENIEEKIRYHKLYDIYKDLLTDKQKTYFEYYYLDDYSLSEIADILSVSRNAVFEQLKKVIEHLEHYENALKNYEKGLLLNEIIEKLRKNTTDDAIISLLKEIEKIEG